MRITGGSLRGRTNPVRVGPGIRPTGARVREALFNVLGQDLHGLSVLDAFGGSGLLAFEAVSRGAGPVTVVERDRRAAAEIARAAEQLGVTIDLRAGDVAKVLRQGQWDVVLLDPPYKDDPLRWLQVATPATRQFLSIEHRAGLALPDRIGDLRLVRHRVYGESALGLYRARATTRLAEDEVVSEDTGMVEGEGQTVQRG